MNFKDILYEKNAGIAKISLNRPEVLNAFRTHTVRELIQAFEDASGDKSVGVIILTGEGERAFCVGGDIRWEKNLSPEDGRRLFLVLMNLANTMRNSGKPIINMVRGYCIGGGLELNLLSDFCIASENAVFGEGGPKIGTLSSLYVPQSLPLLIGERKAREVIYLCRQYSAIEAKQMNWINEVVPDDQLENEVVKWCTELLEKSPQSLRMAKNSMNYISDQLYSAVLKDLDLLSTTYGNEEFIEGMSSFLEKRKPDFSRFR